MKNNILDAANLLWIALLFMGGTTIILMTVLPHWLAREIGSAMVLTLLSGLGALLALLLMIAGMRIEKNDHAARMVKLLDDVKASNAGRR